LEENGIERLREDCQELVVAITKGRYSDIPDRKVKALPCLRGFGTCLGIGYGQAHRVPSRHKEGSWGPRLNAVMRLDTESFYRVRNGEGDSGAIMEDQTTAGSTQPVRNN